MTDKEIYDIITFYKNQPTTKQMRNNLKLVESNLIKRFQKGQNRRFKKIRFFLSKKGQKKFIKRKKVKNTVRF